MSPRARQLALWQWQHQEQRVRRSRRPVRRLRHYRDHHRQHQRLCQRPVCVAGSSGSSGWQLSQRMAQQQRQCRRLRLHRFATQMVVAAAAVPRKVVSAAVDGDSLQQTPPCRSPTFTSLAWQSRRLNGWLERLPLAWRMPRGDERRRRKERRLPKAKEMSKNVAPRS